MANTIFERIFGLTPEMAHYDHILAFVQFVQFFPMLGITSPVYILLDCTMPLSAFTCGMGVLDIPTAMGILANNTELLTNSCLLTTWGLEALLPHAPTSAITLPPLVDFNIYSDPGYPDLLMVLKDAMKDRDLILSGDCSDLFDDAGYSSPTPSMDSALGLED
jgi:hypothetical protein